MSDEAELTIGREFAAGNMERCWQRVQRKVEREGRSAESFSRDIAKAVDEFEKEKPQELKPLIRQVALEAVEGNLEVSRQKTIEGESVGISAQQLLKDQRLVHVANKYTLGGVQTWEFPIC